MERGLMSGLIYAESFDDYTEAKKASYVMGGLSFHTDYGIHGRGMRVGDAAGTGAYIDLPMPSPIYFMTGFAFRINTAGGGDLQMTRHFTSSAGYIGLFYDAASQRLDLSIKVSSASNTHLYTPGGSVLLNKWHYVEYWMRPSTGSQGYAVLALNGEVRATLGPFDYFVNPDMYRIGGPGGDDVDSMDIDDIYISNYDYADYTDDPPFLSPIEVVPLLPTGNGNSSDLVGQDADSTDNYQNVDEQDPDDGTTYNGSDTEGDKDTYAFADLTGSPEIKGLFVTQNAAKTDSGAKFIRPVIRIGGVDYAGDSHALDTDYNTVEVPYEVSPATAVAFTAAEINGAEFGSEIRDS